MILVLDPMVYLPVDLGCRFTAVCFFYNCMTGKGKIFIGSGVTKYGG